MDKKYILVSMEDAKAGNIADILGSKTCKKIIDLLSEKEMPEKEIAEKLGIPINTAEYNLKKLIDAEIIEKTKNFFWSPKGKKVEQYRLSNKSIIISPKKRVGFQIKTILPVAVLSGLAALVVRQITLVPSQAVNYARQVPSALLQSSEAAKTAVSGAGAAVPASAAGSSSEFFLSSAGPEVWFFVGACFAIIVFVLLSLRKIENRKMKGGEK